MMLAPLTQQTMSIEKINSELGYVKIKVDEVELVKSFDIVLHIINPDEIINIVNNIELVVNSYELGTNKGIAIRQIESIKNQVKTLVPHRHKRGLINLGGNVLKWAFGTMDDKDRQDIEKHLNLVDQNNHEIIDTINQQIKINDNFNKTFALIKNAIEADRIKIINKINTIEKRSFIEGVFLDQMVKINFIKQQVESIQENFASARLGILHPSILTNEEIQAYDIDSRKLSQIRLGLAKHLNGTIVFAIKIPREFEKFDKKIVLPICNSNSKQIDQDIEYVVEDNNKMYTYEDDETNKELKQSKNCILKNNCRFISSNEEYIEIGDDILIVSNAKNKM